MDITRNLNGARALAVGAGLALMLAVSAAPTPAMAAGRFGTTDVRVRTEIDNISFKAPTIIPFVANADGKLQCPSEDAITIDNLSAYGIHVTNMKIDATNTWTIAADAKAGSAQNSIDFKVGPTDNLQDAYAATQGTGIDLSKNVAFDMGLSGHCRRVGQDQAQKRAETSPASRATSSTSQALQIRPKPATR